jgi:hypothetical protein
VRSVRNPASCRVLRIARHPEVSSPESLAASVTVHAVPGISTNIPLTRLNASLTDVVRSESFGQEDLCFIQIR